MTSLISKHLYIASSFLFELFVDQAKGKLYFYFACCVICCFLLLYRLSSVCFLTCYFLFLESGQWIQLLTTLKSEDCTSGLPRYLDFRDCVRSDRKYFCPRSPNRVYKNSRNLKRHIRYETANSTICHLCSLNFPDKSSLIRHLHIRHSRMVVVKS